MSPDAARIVVPRGRLSGVAVRVATAPGGIAPGAGDTARAAATAVRIARCSLPPARPVARKLACRSSRAATSRATARTVTSRGRAAGTEADGIDERYAN